MYNLDSNSNKEEKQKLTSNGGKQSKNILIAILALAVGFGIGALSFNQNFDSLFDQLELSAINLRQKTDEPQKIIETKIIEYVPQTSQEDAVIQVVKDYSSAVASIVITKNMPIYEQYYVSPFRGFFGEEFQIPQVRQKGTEEQEVGAGTGFIVSEDGLMITNKHVVIDEEAQYTVTTVDGKKYPAKVMALDPVQDVAIVKIDADEGQKFPAVVLGDSDNLQIGQSVIAIGNTLGEFDNTVSVGVISGLQRTIVAGGAGVQSETLDNLIQTDAAINEGNSGGPLLNLKGEVIGLNTAIASNAQNVGFVIPINLAKRDLEQVKTLGKIAYPYLGIYYTMIDNDIQKENQLPINYGAWIAPPGMSAQGRRIAPVIAESPAFNAGLKEGDIILEINGQKLDKDNSLSRVVAKYNPGDKVELKVLRGDERIDLEAVLGDRNEEK